VAVVPAQRFARRSCDRLARLMIRCGVGVRTRHTYRLVEIDEDFFE
jgi:restriction endonuclease Mrr